MTVPTKTRQLLEGLGQIAKETGVRVQTHLSECRPEGSFFNYVDQNLYIVDISSTNYLPRLQGRHGEFEPGKAQYSTPSFFDRLFLTRAY